MWECGVSHYRVLESAMGFKFWFDDWGEGLTKRRLSRMDTVRKQGQCYDWVKKEQALE